ncbi:MAG: hypothetical protein SFZ24_00555 [Planctomycetota bacterium]|nr:hypothetical protein [Planctomycetota bacterium]
MSLPAAGLVPGAADGSEPAAAARQGAGGGGGGDGAPLGGRIGTTQGDRPPLAPTGVTTAASLDGGAVVKWTDPSSDEVAFEIERTPAFGDGIIRVAANTTEYVDPQDLPEARYRVRSIGATLNSKWSSWIDVRSLSEGFPVLRPGSGFSGGAAEPVAIGTPDMAGFDAKAIARWDVVPYQTFTGNFHVGVVAFHMNGIDRVEFSVNGGPWASVREMKLNPRTNVWEYTAIVRASDFEDGPVEVRAVAYPKDAGVPRAVTPLRLFANTNGGLPTMQAYVSPQGDDVAGTGTREAPFRSIFRAAKAIQDMSGQGRADGGQVLLLPGDYDWGKAGYNADGRYIGNLTTVDRWLEVRAAPGVSRDQVRIVSASGGGLKTLRQRIAGITLLASPANSAATGTLPSLWLDGCLMTNPSRTTDIKWTPTSGYAGGIWVTSCEVQGGRYGFVGAQLVRNSKVSGTGDDTFTNCQMIVNVEVSDLRIPAGSGFHSDVFQLHASATPLSNIIVYNLVATNCAAQPWHVGYTGHVRGPDWSDIALVNILIEAEGNYTAQWIPSTNHLLLWHSTILGAPVILRDSPLVNGATTPVPTNIRNFSLRHNIINRFSMSHSGMLPNAADTSWASNNHFIDTTTYGARVVGTFATTGGQFESLFVNAASDNFRPAASNLRGRFNYPIVPRDATMRAVTDSIGALQP